MKANVMGLLRAAAAAILLTGTLAACDSSSTSGGASVPSVRVGSRDSSMLAMIRSSERLQRRAKAAALSHPLPTAGYLHQACELPPQWVRYVYRGWASGKVRDEDLIVVPNPPNYMGTQTDTSHSSPYGFTQEVPFVWYGPDFIKSLGDVKLGREVTIADDAPTVGDLVGYHFDAGPSRPLTQIMTAINRKPKLVVTVVIDGGGWDDLVQWPNDWPNIRKLMSEGTNVRDVIVGSSPSITPATHTTLSTGTFPRYHGVTAIVVRNNAGKLVGAYSIKAQDPGPAVADPRVSLRRPTVADLYDRARGNKPKVGMLSAGNLQLGMVGHGAAFKGGDKDVAIMLHGSNPSIASWETNPKFYTRPGYINSQVRGPKRDIEAVDRQDGKADGLWRNHEIAPLDATPAFAPWENRTMEAVLKREGFGKDGTPDLFYINYKATDVAGHHWNMVNPEQKDVLKSIDDAIGQLKTWLDANVGNNQYVLTITADHGQTPLGVGGWAISRHEIVNDINERFDHVGNAEGVLEQTSATSFFVQADEMARNHVTPEQVSEYLDHYTIGDNIAPGAKPPAGFGNRVNDPIFAAVFPGRDLNKVVACTHALGR